MRIIFKKVNNGVYLSAIFALNNKTNMKEEDYYPAGAYKDPNAPYNQCEQDAKEFSVIATETLSRCTSVHTNDFVYDCGYDEDGAYEYFDTSSTDWKEAYINECYTIENLLKELKILAAEKYELTKDKKYIRIAEACDEFEVEEINVEEDK